MKGAAVRIHGYDALEGFGITRIRNQTVDRSPKNKKIIPGDIFQALNLE
jgi:hypothetical protein